MTLVAFGSLILIAINFPLRMQKAFHPDSVWPTDSQDKILVTAPEP